MIRYHDRLRIPVEGSVEQQLFTASGVHFSNGFCRVVIGGRGPYVEFTRKQIMCDLPESKTPHYYYIERRSIPDGIKVYDQLHRVDYADYLVGMLYVSPFDLFLGNGDRVICVDEDRQLRLPI